MGVLLEVLLKTDSGFIDLGRDQVFELDDDDNLVATFDGTWLDCPLCASSRRPSSADSLFWLAICKIPYDFFVAITDGAGASFNCASCVRRGRIQGLADRGDVRLREYLEGSFPDRAYLLDWTWGPTARLATLRCSNRQPTG